MDEVSDCIDVLQKQAVGGNMLEAVLIIAAILAVFFGIVILVDVNRFVVVQYDIPSRKIKEEYHFVLLADLHNKSFGKKNERLIRAIEGLYPDAVMIAGDMLTAKKKAGEYYDTALQLLETLSKEKPVYYGLGNHEYRMKIYPENYNNAYAEYLQQLKRLGVQVLDNDSIMLSGMNPISVTGISIDRYYYKRLAKINMDVSYLKDTVREPERGRFQILLAHNPEYFPQYAEWGADLVLSGHVHGGIAKLPMLGGVISPKLSLFPKYDGGLFTEGKSRMILSRGLGTHTLPLRVFNPGELISVRLVPENISSDCLNG